MSGGHYEYRYHQLEQLADDIETSSRENFELAPEILAARDRFCGLLRKCASAAKDIEWVDSCDSSPGDEIPRLAALGLWDGPKTFYVDEGKVIDPTVGDPPEFEHGIRYVKIKHADGLHHLAQVHIIP